MWLEILSWPLKNRTFQNWFTRRVEQLVEQLVKDKAKGLKGELEAQIKEVNGVQFLATQVDLDANGAKDLAYELGNNKAILWKYGKRCWIS